MPGIVSHWHRARVMGQPSGYLTLALPSGQTNTDLVDALARAVCRGASGDDIPAELTDGFGQSDDGEFVFDRFNAGLIRAATGSEGSRPRREKDPIAWESFERGMANSSLLAKAHATPPTEPSTVSTCRCCGEPIPAGNAAWDYEAPDPMLLLPDAEADRVRVLNSSVCIADGIGNFIRIMPVDMDDGRTAALGVWIYLRYEEYERGRHAITGGVSTWQGMRISGRLATAVQPWPDAFGAIVTATVPADTAVTETRAPYLTETDNELLHDVLTRSWALHEVFRGRNAHQPRPIPPHDRTRLSTRMSRRPRTPVSLSTNRSASSRRGTRN
ncbi:DUF2199 domain-containing protein [Luedemannella flava]